jgi:hypothetical protein
MAETVMHGVAIVVLVGMTIGGVFGFWETFLRKR